MGGHCTQLRKGSWGPELDEASLKDRKQQLRVCTQGAVTGSGPKEVLLPQGRDWCRCAVLGTEENGDLSTDDLN